MKRKFTGTEFYLNECKCILHSSVTEAIEERTRPIEGSKIILKVLISYRELVHLALRFFNQKYSVEANIHC